MKYIADAFIQLVNLEFLELFLHKNNLSGIVENINNLSYILKYLPKNLLDLKVYLYCNFLGKN